MTTWFWWMLMFLPLMGVTTTITIAACTGCCGGTCDGYPDEFQVTLEGQGSCGCISAGGINSQVTASSGMNGVFTVTRQVGNPNRWSAHGGTIDLTNYPFADCTGAPDPAVTFYASLFLICVDGNLFFREILTPGDYTDDPSAPDTLSAGFVAGDPDNSIALDEVIPNELQCDTGNYYFADGTVMVEEVP